MLVKGAVVSTEDLVIDGQVEGTIELGNHSLTIGSGSVIIADLVAKSVTIAGTVKGSVMGSSMVSLKSTARVEGDVVAPKFAMEEGALLVGKVDTGAKKS